MTYAKHVFEGPYSRCAKCHRSKDNELHVSHEPVEASDTLEERTTTTQLETIDGPRPIINQTVVAVTNPTPISTPSIPSKPEPTFSKPEPTPRLETLPCDWTIAHEFRGENFCGACGKPKADEIHQPVLAPIYCTQCGHLFVPTKANEFTCKTCHEKPEQVILDVLTPKTILDVVLESGKCSTSADSIDDFDSPQTEPLNQDAAIINRQLNIDEVFRNALEGPLTPLEIKQAQMEHEALLLLEWSKTDNWRDAYEAHIRDIQSKIQRYRALEVTARKVRTIKQTEEIASLTPEEREQCKQYAMRPSKPKATKSEPKPVSLESEAKVYLKKRLAMIDALAAMGQNRAEIEKQFPVDPKYIQFSHPPMPAHRTPPRQQTKRERMIDKIVQTGISREDAEKMIPEDLA